MAAQGNLDFLYNTEKELGALLEKEFGKEIRVSVEKDEGSPLTQPLYNIVLENLCRESNRWFYKKILLKDSV